MVTWKQVSKRELMKLNLMVGLSNKSLHVHQARVGVVDRILIAICIFSYLLRNLYKSSAFVIQDGSFSELPLNFSL